MTETRTHATWSELLTAEHMSRLALLCLGIWLNAADSLVTATIMPSVARDIGGYSYFAWPVAAYLVGAIMGGTGAGRVAERIGLRAALILAASLYAAGCVMGALASAIGLFLIGRLFQGAGAGLIVGLCYVAANMLFPAELWRRLLALISGVWGIATVLGPLVGGIFAQAGMWRVVFWLFAGQALLFAVTAWAILPSRTSTNAHMSRVPVATLGLLAFAILLLLIAGNAGAATWRSIATLLCGAALLIITLARDAAARVRFLPREVSDLRHVSGQGYAAIFLFGASAVGFSVYGAAILQSLYGLSPLAAGYVIGAEAMGWTATALVVAEFSHDAEVACIRGGATAILLSMIALIFAMPSGSLWTVLLVAIALGAGFGASWAFLTRRIVEHLPVDDQSIGSAAVPTVQMIGSAIGSAIAGLTANTFGAVHGVSFANARQIATWTFVAATPFAFFAWTSAWRASRSERRKLAPAIDAQAVD